MAINPNRDHCHNELIEPGALVFGPPDNLNRSRKYHVCRVCWPLLQNWIKK